MSALAWSERLCAETHADMMVSCNRSLRRRPLSPRRRSLIIGDIRMWISDTVPNVNANVNVSTDFFSFTNQNNGLGSDLSYHGNVLNKMMF